MKLTYFKLELKRALKRLPYLYAGALLLFLLTGATGFLASQLLYGEGIVGRIQVGVSVPEEDATAQQVVQMLGTMDSVSSICDFVYMDLESALKELDEGRLFTVLEVPKGFVQDIINGNNTPVVVWLPERAHLEGRLFQTLTAAGAKTLSAGQAGIYAGNELYVLNGADTSILALENDLNRYYLDFSLQRLDYFRHLEIIGTGDVGIVQFYILSAFVLFLLLVPVAAGEYLLPLSYTVRVKLDAAGLNGGTRVISRVLGLTLLLLAVSLPVIIAAVVRDVFKLTGLLFVSWLLTCAAVSVLAVFFYNLSGTLLGGLLLTFLSATGQHFMAGGFLPAVFLPTFIRNVSQLLPSAFLINTMKMAMLNKSDGSLIAAVVIFIAIGTFINIILETAFRERRPS